MLIILHFRTIAYVLKEIMDHLPPLYLNHLSRYNDIAKYGFFANEIHGPSVEVPPSKNESSTPDSKNLTDKPTDLEGYTPTCSFRIIASATLFLSPSK